MEDLETMWDKMLLMPRADNLEIIDAYLDSLPHNEAYRFFLLLQGITPSGDFEKDNAEYQILREIAERGGLRDFVEQNGIDAKSHTPPNH